MANFSQRDQQQRGSLIKNFHLYNKENPLKKLILTSLLLLSFLMMSCTENGELKIINSTNGELFVKIEGAENTIAGGDDYSREWELDNSIFNTEEKDVTLESAGIFKFYFTEEYKIQPGNTTRVTVNADAGAVKILNYSTNLNIVDVYLSPSDQQYWGSDMLESTVSPGYWVAFRVESGYWDVRVIDQYGNEYFAYDEYVTINNFKELNFNPDGASIFGAMNKKQEGTHISAPSLKKEFYDMGAK